MGECRVSFPGPVTRKTMSCLVIDYLKYILYYRGQFPLPLDQLKSLISKRAKLCQTDEVSTVGSHLIFCDDQVQSKSSVSRYVYCVKGLWLSFRQNK